MGEVIAAGSTSRVQSAVRRSDGEPVALKILNCRDEEMLRVAQAEYEMLKGLNHPNIIGAVDFHIAAGHGVLVLERMSGGTLRQVVANASTKGLDEATCRSFTHQLCSAVSYLHAQGILHRDIKPENVLVSGDGTRICLADFNCATLVAHALTPAGTLLYSAPEVVQGQAASEAADMWGIGLCAYFMMTGSLPQSRGKRSVSRAALRAHAGQEVTFRGQELQALPAHGCSFIASCLRLQDQERPSAAEAELHEWFAVS